VKLATILTRAAERATSSDELRSCLKQQVATPQRVRLVPDLPEGPTGKILKRAIEPPQSG
jgi:acyl-coenzyme A synthetase/AMP-(fatty) acid ligase